MGILRRLSSKSRRKWKQLLKSKKKPKRKMTALEKKRKKEKEKNMDELAGFILENDIDIGKLMKLGKMADEKGMSITEFVKEDYVEVEQTTDDDGGTVTKIRVYSGGEEKEEDEQSIKRT